MIFYSTKRKCQISLLQIIPMFPICNILVIGIPTFFINYIIEASGQIILKCTNKDTNILINRD